MNGNAASEEKIMTGMLREDLEVIPPGEHGSEWMLFDPVGGDYYKLTEETCRVIRLMKTSMELNDFCNELNAHGIPVSRSELLDILRFLHGNGLVVPEYGSLGRKKILYGEMKKKTLLYRLAAAYLFFRLPPLRPDLFFSRTASAVHLFFNRWTVSLLVLAALTGYLKLLQNWNLVSSTFLDSLSWSGLVHYFWAILVIKIFHELAHGYVAKSFGCRVRGIGISFIVFYPRLFTDLTDSWRLSRVKRLAIDGAGIGFELVFGGLAGLIWLNSAPGALHSTMFYLFAVSTFGTILINGNPFIRYDGYYLLCDLVNVDNLMQRSGDYLKSWNRYLLFGIGSRPEAPAEVSPVFLYLFGLSSFLYRIFLYSSIILLVYFKFAKPLAIFLAFIELLTMILLPFYRECRIVSSLRKGMNRRNLKFTGIGVAVLMLLLLTPLPWSFSMPCEIQPMDTETVSVRESGYAVRDLPEDAFPVASGGCIIPMENPFLSRTIRKLSLAVQEADAELEFLRSDSKTISQSRTAYEKRESVFLSLEEMRRRGDGLVLKSSLDGLFVPRIREVSSGRWLEKGTLLGEVFSSESKILLYAKDREVNRIRVGDQVRIFFPDEVPGFSGRVAAVNPVPASFRYSPLVQLFGGPLPCRPNRSMNEFHPLQVVYCVQVIPDRPLIRLYGRTGQAKISKYYVLGAVLFRDLLHLFHRELSF